MDQLTDKNLGVSDGNGFLVCGTYKTHAELDFALEELKAEGFVRSTLKVDDLEIPKHKSRSYNDIRRSEDFLLSIEVKKSQESPQNVLRAKKILLETGALEISVRENLRPSFLDNSRSMEG